MVKKRDSSKKKSNSIELNEEQKELQRLIIKWYHNFPYGKPYFYYSGAAGTGKTTVMKSIIKELGLKQDEYIACAYVGKAVLVLLRNGLPASTIHSFIYRPQSETYFDIEFDEWGNPHKVKKKKARFSLRDHIPKSIKLIFLDECAMVNDKMRMDLQSFGVPIVMAGDCNQLPPVFGSSSILDDPDYTLYQIMRQKEGDPIIYLSQCILNDIQVPYGDYGASKVIDSFNFDKRLLTDYDMILCAKNATREDLNDRIREEILGYDDRVPRDGDKMICRRNDWDESLDGIYLTNGLVGNIEHVNTCSIHRDLVYGDFTPDFMDRPFEKLTLDYFYLKSNWKVRKDYGWGGKKDDPVELFEYAYAITVHLSQGSEYNRVLYIDEDFRDADTFKRLQYTAVTRAKDSITWVRSQREKKFYFPTYSTPFDTPLNERGPVKMIS